MSREKDVPPIPPAPPRAGLGRVHIYGGGITGLTAAHELARRGFRVRVYEPAQEYDETGHAEAQAPSPVTSFRMAVGGMARSQYLRVPKGAPGNFPRQGQFVTSDSHRAFLRYSPDLEASEWEQQLHTLAYSFVYGRGYFDGYTGGRSPGVLYIRVYSNPGEGPDPFYDKLLGDAWNLREKLTTMSVEQITSPALHRSRVIVVQREDDALAHELGAPFPPLDSPGIQFEMYHFLPGEHGFRFFPSYYRHLFSTMVETPILDEQGRFTGRRVFDNLVPSSFYGIAAQGRRIRFLRRAPASRPVELLQELRDLASSGYPPSDTLQFTLRIWRYLCTCSERRKADFERISWWEYLEGYDPEKKTRRYQYSAAFMRDMQFAPRVLAAFDGAWGDARTNGNTLAQLYLNNLMPLPKTDGTLNGPTTSAWFRPWRRYLEEHLRVEFYAMKLHRFALERGRLVPYCLAGEWEFVDTHSNANGSDEDSDPVDYYLVATDAVTAEQVTRGLPRVGIVEGLQGFTSRVPPNPRGPEPAEERSPGVLPGHVPWDRFQTLTGIQFFFPTTTRLAEGYLFFLDAPWGLSAISSQQYWATPPTFDQDGFSSVLSVDIGNWYVREPGVGSPSHSSRHELAHEVWRQVREATEQHHAPLPHAGHYGFVLPEPSWYHMDRFIRFETDPATGKERPVKNLAPYLIPIVGDWDRRPGPEPWDPMAPDPEATERASLPEGLWQAPHGGYPVHWKQLVFAGTWLKTFTRMTTMESANESARHAVNAIIDHYLTCHEPKKREPTRGVAPPRASPTVPEYSGQGSLTGSPDFRLTPIGEYCRIWDPEKHELPELAPLRELDAKLFALGLPHVWDLLHLEPLALPLLAPLDASGDGAEALSSFLARVREALEPLSNPLWPGSVWPGP
ncbi:NAD(P)-binding protein [Pyxidicoccus trucidator]|uniref:NAD(P)-binding protein n=1 Tax=Pyxidicoccus trucidator TaxID=2709662 RepID=UPI0019683462|nr:NAD(P)-binding protein [Pyxidicoccus trucidator]